jgi:hypothetical protein
VVTVNCRFPGSLTADAGRLTVICEELTNVEAMSVPFRATVEEELKPVPLMVRVAAVLIGPVLGVMEETLGGGGGMMVTVSVFEVEGVEVELTTVTLAVPVVVRRFAGTVAAMDCEVPP